MEDPAAGACGGAMASGRAFSALLDPQADERGASEASPRGIGADCQCPGTSALSAPCVSLRAAAAELVGTVTPGMV